MSRADRLGSDQRVDREQQIRNVVDELQTRRERGEPVDDDSVIAAHPELCPELERRLRMATLARRARRRAESSDSDTISHDDPSTHGSESGALHIRCPHCRQKSVWAPDAPSARIVCPDCGEPFHLIDDREETQGPRAVRRLAQFELLQQIGAGGFGTVWKAHDTELDRMVAIKIPRADRLALEDIDKFLREARSAARINHPNIVQIYEAGREGETVYLVSELVEGIPLSEWMADRRPTVSEAVELCQTIAAAVHQAHEAGVVHRDLKPANIMIDGKGQPHVMDFGLAKRDRAGVSAVTVEGQVLGTPAYMSPEQAGGQAHRCDARTDVYGLGVVLFELLTDELPFRGKSSMLLFQIMNDDPPSPRKLNGRVPRDLETVCLKCLDKDPGRRYSTAQKLADDLGRFQRGEPIHARPVGRFLQAARWCQRNRRVAALLATVFLLLAVVAAGSLVFTVRLARAQMDTADAETRARANFDKAQEAVDGILIELGMDRLTVEPHSTPLRRALLQRALDFYVKLSAEESRDPAVRLETSQAHLNVAVISKHLGDFERAAEESAMSAEVLRQLVRDHPRNVLYRAQLAQCHSFAGNLAELRGDPRTAARFYDKALEALAQSPDMQNPGIRRELARARYGLGVLHWRSGRSKDALDELNAARELQWQLVEDDEGNRENQQELCHIMQDLANVLSNSPGRRAEGESLLIEALDRCRKLAQTNRLPTVLEQRARLQIDLANVQTYDGRHDEACRNYREAIEHLEQLVRDYPHVPGYQLQLGNALGNLAFELTDPAPMEAEQQFKRAVDTLTVLIDRSGSVPSYLESLALILNNQGYVLFGLEEYDRARESFATAHEIWIARMQEHDDNAEYHRMAAAAVHALGKLAQPGKPEEAIDLFHQAIDHQQAALRIDAEHGTSRSFMANHFTDLGITFKSLKQHREAALAFEKGVQITAELMRDFPTAEYYRMQYIRVTNELAWLLAITDVVKLRDDSRAVALAEQVVTMLPQEGAVWNTLGLACYRQEDWQRAADALRQATELNDGTDATDFLYLSMTQTQLGQLAEARETYKQALQVLDSANNLDEDLEALRKEAARLLGDEQLP